MPCISYTELAMLPWEPCSTFSQHISCALKKWSGHLSQISQDGLKHSEVILSCKQLIPNSNVFTWKGKTAARDFTCA